MLRRPGHPAQRTSQPWLGRPLKRLCGPGHGRPLPLRLGHPLLALRLDHPLLPLRPGHPLLALRLGLAIRWGLCVFVILSQQLGRDIYSSRQPGGCNLRPGNIGNFYSGRRIMQGRN